MIRFLQFVSLLLFVAMNDGGNSFTTIVANVYGAKATNVTLAALPSLVSLSSDLNGNLTNDGLKTMAFDAENRMTNVYVPGAWKTESVFDGLGRRRIERNYAWQGGAWVKTNETRFVCVGDLKNITTPQCARTSPSRIIQFARAIGTLMPFSSVEIVMLSFCSRRKSSSSGMRSEDSTSIRIQSGVPTAERRSAFERRRPRCQNQKSPTTKGAENSEMTLQLTIDIHWRRVSEPGR